MKTLKYKSIGIELAMLGIIFCAFILEMAYTTTTSWYRVLVYEADSLTLPLIYKSHELHEPAQWVFSAQFNLFPEAILYVVSALFVGSFKQALFINALLNIAILYGLIRCLLKTATRVDLASRRLYGLFTMALLFGFMLLETPTAFGQALYTYILFNTYYSGPLFIGLSNIVMFSYFIRNQKRLTEKRGRVCIIVFGLITTFSVVSNPLYALHFALPLSAILVLMYLLKTIKRSTAVLLALTQVIAVPAALVLRQLFFMPLTGESASSHIASLESLLNAMRQLNFALFSVAPMHATAGFKIRVLITVLIYFACLLAILIMLNRHFKYKKKLMRPELLFVGFCITLEPIIVIMSLYGSINVPGRYLITPLLLSLLSVVFAGGLDKTGYFKKIATCGVIVFSVCAVAGAFLFGNKIQPYFSYYDEDNQCLAKSLGYKPANGLGDYSIARALDMHNVYDQRILQASNEPQIYPWLNNIGAYANKNYSFYVVEHDRHFSQLFDVALDSPPPNWSFKTVCKEYDIYHYTPGTPGYDDINNGLKDSYEFMTRTRNDGKLADLKASLVKRPLPEPRNW